MHQCSVSPRWAGPESTAETNYLTAASSVEGAVQLSSFAQSLAEKEQEEASCLCAEPRRPWRDRALVLTKSLTTMFDAAGAALRHHLPVQCWQRRGENQYLRAGFERQRNLDAWNQMQLLLDEVAAEVVACLGLQDIAELAATCLPLYHQFWLATGPWQRLACRYGLHLHTTHRPWDELGMAREAFRRSIFRIDGRLLQQLCSEIKCTGCPGTTAVLDEAAHVARGLLPHDGLAVVEQLCAMAERALQAHDPGNAEAAHGAGAFLRVVERRCRVFSQEQLERLCLAYENALQLHQLLEAVEQEHFAELEAQQVDELHQHTDPYLLDQDCRRSTCTSPVDWGLGPRSQRSMSSPSLQEDCETLTTEEQITAEFEDAHEAQWCLGFDSLLHELERYSLAPE
mmetsp:Transcript_14112/g.27360  ORF Transcript_14112/g.27360 Transcript_14112/m.27360 type:complete len:399 (+) Transcript_14112:68-1264(+)